MATGQRASALCVYPGGSGHFFSHSCGEAGSVETVEPWLVHGGDLAQHDNQSVRNGGLVFFRGGAYRPYNARVQNGHTPFVIRPQSEELLGRKNSPWAPA